MASVGSYRNPAHRKQQERATEASLSTTAKSVSKYKPPRRTNFPSSSPSSSSASASASASSFATGKDSVCNGNGVPGRVRVAVRLRPRNEEEKVADADFADCVEVQPEFKRLKLKKNNWDSDTYEFDEVLTEFSSQKRAYEVVAKPVVESVLDGYNGTIMAYGQTGTGKTFTLGRFGDDDIATRGIMVRAMEDILNNISSENDSVSVSYLQLYMETVQDMLDPGNDNISVVDDPKTGDVSLPGAISVRIRDQKSFLELLQLGEAHRYAANTNLNTESSRSHAILVVTVKRPLNGKESPVSIDNGHNAGFIKNMKAPIVRKAKLVIVDLAGSERVTKSGSEGHNLEEAKSINLSLSALGKCINALAENSTHVPFRDSKLTRLLRDSFGGTARTSLVVTIGPSPRHRGETASTILFGQRAMKVENMVRIKEEFDYRSLCRRLEIQIERLTADHERQLKILEDNAQNIRVESCNRIGEAERKHKNALENERLKYQAEYMESLRKLEEQWMHQQKPTSKISFQEEVVQLRKVLQKETLRREAAEEELNNLRNQLVQWKKSEAAKTSDLINLHKLLEDETRKNEKLEEDILVLQSKLVQTGFQTDETRKKVDDRVGESGPTGTDSLAPQSRSPQSHFTEFAEKSSVAKLFEQVGLQKILSLLEAEDDDVRIHAVKVVANLAAEEANQKKIVEAGGLSSLLMLLKTSDDETIHRVAAGALANLAMSESNQDLIMAQGGVSLLSKTAARAEDPQTLRMVAGAVANLCGNDKLQKKLRAEGGIRALLGMVTSRHPDVLAQVARGIANFAKCESRGWTQGTKTGRSLLIDDGALPWIIRNSNNEASSQVRRHLELALCHLAQHEVNAKDMILSGALWELVRISQDSPLEDIRTLADRTLASSPSLQAELMRTY